MVCGIFVATIVCSKAGAWQAPHQTLLGHPVHHCRPVILLFAAWLFFTRAQQPTLTVWLLIGMIAVLMVFDAFTTQAWFDMMGRALSPRVRARVITINSLLGSIGGYGSRSGSYAGAGFAPTALPHQLRTPVFSGLAVHHFLVGVHAVHSERLGETAPPSQAHQSSFNTKLRAAWQNDPAFRRLLLTRLLTGVENMAAAFYIVFARERLGLPDSAIGVFTIAYVVGGLIGITVFGTLSERYGPRRAINAACTLQFIAPLIAFFVATFQPYTPLNLQTQTLAYGALIVVMAINGAVNRSTQVGFFSYAQDSAPEADRPIYVGAVSTIAGTASLLPVLGGVLIDALLRSGFSAAAYPVLFGIAVVIVGIGTRIEFWIAEADAHVK